MISKKEIKRLLVDELSRGVEDKVILVGMKFYEKKEPDLMIKQVKSVVADMIQEYPKVKFSWHVLDEDEEGVIIANMEFKEGRFEK